MQILLLTALSFYVISALSAMDGILDITEINHELSCRSYMMRARKSKEKDKILRLNNALLNGDGEIDLSDLCSLHKGAFPVKIKRKYDGNLSSTGSFFPIVEFLKYKNLYICNNEKGEEGPKTLIIFNSEDVFIDFIPAFVEKLLIYDVKTLVFSSKVDFSHIRILSFKNISSITSELKNPDGTACKANVLLKGDSFNKIQFERISNVSLHCEKCTDLVFKEVKDIRVLSLNMVEKFYIYKAQNVCIPRNTQTNQLDTDEFMLDVKSQTFMDGDTGSYIRCPEGFYKSVTKLIIKNYSIPIKEYNTLDLYKFSKVSQLDLIEFSTIFIPKISSLNRMNLNVHDCEHVTMDQKNYFNEVTFVRCRDVELCGRFSRAFILGCSELSFLSDFMCYGKTDILMSNSVDRDPKAFFQELYINTINCSELLSSGRAAPGQG